MRNEYHRVSHEINHIQLHPTKEAILEILENSGVHINNIVTFVFCPVTSNPCSPERHLLSSNPR